jgi:hypothetical protein
VISKGSPVAPKSNVASWLKLLSIFRTLSSLFEERA